MNAQGWNLLLSLFIGWMGVVLFLTALIRRYPVRSVFVYALIAVLSTLSVAGAFGGWAITYLNLHRDALNYLSFATSIGRGTAIVLLASLIWYEHTRKYTKH